MIKQWEELQVGDLLEWMDGADGPGHAIRLLRIKEIGKPPDHEPGYVSGRGVERGYGKPDRVDVTLTLCPSWYYAYEGVPAYRIKAQGDRFQPEEEDARFRGVPHLEDIPMLERDMNRFMSLEHKSLDTIRHMEHLNLRIVRAKQAQGIPLTDLDKLTLRIETKVL